jgi:hypothetical protein
MTTSKQSTQIYTIERVTFETLKSEFEFCKSVAESVAKTFDGKFDWRNFNVVRYVDSQRVMMCRRNGVPVGVMLASRYVSVFDSKKVILRQDLLWAKPGTRAAWYLLRDFVDFGKANADHLITMIGDKTNIKRQTIEKLGFKKIEEIYRMENR